MVQLGGDEICELRPKYWLQLMKSKSTTLVDFDETMIYHYRTYSDSQVYTKDKRALIVAQRTCDVED